MSYQLEGRIIEVCTCNVVCPCWVGGDPDGDGTCQAIVAWHIDNGTIDGVDVSGRTVGLLANIPGNVREGGWRVVAVLDDASTTAQQEALLSVWTGKQGGPVADIVSLVGEVVSVELRPVTFEVVDGRGVVRLGDLAEAEVAPVLGLDGQPTTLNSTSVYAQNPEAPAYISQASHYRSQVPELGVDLSLNGQNAVQGSFRFEA